MEYQIKDVGTCRKLIEMKFTAEEVDKSFDECYLNINSQVRIKGFRQGKAPRKVLESRFAKDAASDVVKALIRSELDKLREKEKLQTAGSYLLKNSDGLAEPHKPINLDLEFDVIPEFELPEYRGIELTDQPVEVKEEKITEMLERYRRMFANYQEIEEPARQDDIIKVDFETKVDGEEIMHMENQRLRVDGNILFGLPCPQLVEKFTGVQKGDFVELPITLPDDHPNPELRNKEARVEVTVKGVERGDLPELNDAFSEGLGMGTLSQLRERIRENLARDAFMEAKQKEEDEIVDKLLAAAPFEVPEAMVKSETDAIIQQRRLQQIRTGVKEDDAMRHQLEAFRPEAEKDALRKVRWGILAGKIGEKEQVKVTNDDLAAQVEALARQYNTTPAKIVQRIREFDGMQPMLAEIQSAKVLQIIAENAKGRPEKRAAADMERANAAAVATAYNMMTDGKE